MKIDLADAALGVPEQAGRGAYAAWHWLWAKIFGQRVPTSGKRAHIGKLVLKYQPPGTAPGISDFEKGWMTDANRVYVIGDLWVFDYGDTPIKTLTPQFDNSGLHRNYSGEHDALLQENIKEFGKS